MKIQMPYGQKSFSINCSNKFNLIKRDTYSRREDIKKGMPVINKALTGPLSGREVLTSLKPSDRVAIVINDYTRPTDSRKILPELLTRLKKEGIRSQNITVVIALGLHRPASDTEIEQLVGEKIKDEIRIVNHDPDNNLTDLGKVSLNSDVAEASLVILTGAVTFHPMAGFSGGYKSLLPGVASRRDILQNHYLYFKTLTGEYNIGPGCIQNNPVLTDIQGRGKKLNRVLALNVVLGEEKEIIKAEFGHVEDVWNSCVKFLKDLYMVEIPEKYPLVIASAGGFPADISFYQCMKVFNNSARACQPGGKIIIFAECSQGWELEGELLTYFSYPREKMIKAIKENFSMAGLAVFMAFQIINNYQVHFFSSLPPGEVNKTGMIPEDNLDRITDIINDSTQKYAVIPAASYVLPNLIQ